MVKHSFHQETLFRMIMALVDILDQTNVETALLNGEHKENLYMAQPTGFVMKEIKKIGCHLKRSIYRSKQDCRY